MSRSNNLPPGCAAMLEHPNGTKVYLVGTAYVSYQAPQDVMECVEHVKPRYVVLELDKKRYRDTLKQFIVTENRYGIARTRYRALIEELGALLSGTVLEYLSGLSIKVAGAFVGSPAGDDVVAAHLAAKHVGAALVMADRDQSTTYLRLVWRTAEYNRAVQQIAHDPVAIPRAQESMLRAKGEAVPLDPAVGTADDGKDLDADTGNAGVLRDDEGLMEQSTWRRLLQDGGCENADRVIRAFKRILREGQSKAGNVRVEDVATVRPCARKLVEHYRQLAIEEGDDVLKELERKAVGEVSASQGLDPSRQAMQEVLGHEEEYIAARGLWEAADLAMGRPCVGVVGAAHIKGIQRNWSQVGTPEGALQAAEYMSPPPGYSPAFPYLASAAVLTTTGLIAYHRPRLMMITAAVATAVSTPYIVFGISVVHGWQRIAQKVAGVAEQLDEEDDSSGVAMWPEQLSKLEGRRPGASLGGSTSAL